MLLFRQESLGDLPLLSGSVGAPVLRKPSVTVSVRKAELRNSLIRICLISAFPMPKAAYKSLQQRCQTWDPRARCSCPKQFLQPHYNWLPPE